MHLCVVCVGNDALIVSVWSAQQAGGRGALITASAGEYVGLYDALKAPMVSVTLGHIPSGDECRCGVYRRNGVKAADWQAGEWVLVAEWPVEGPPIGRWADVTITTVTERVTGPCRRRGRGTGPVQLEARKVPILRRG